MMPTFLRALLALALVIVMALLTATVIQALWRATVR